MAADSFAFYGVCKNWKSVEKIPHQNIDDLSVCPFLKFSNNRFFHPLHNVYFQLDNIIHRFPQGIIRCSNYGWLLMTKSNEAAFFFNPSTKERIDLPATPATINTLKFLTFSRPPTSPDCEVVNIRNIGDDLVVDTIKRGEDDFSIEYIFRFRFRIAWCNPVFYNGKYYCMGEDGNLVIYNPKRNKHRRTGCPRQLWRHFSELDCQYYMFEGEGELWAVFVAHRGREVCVCKLNLGKMEWEIVNDLEDRMVFVSNGASFLERAKVRGAGNKIYFPKFIGNNGLFYSLATRKYHTYERGGTSQPNFFNSKEMSSSTWIRIDSQHLKPQTCEEDLLMW